jgi:hypothetical protein
MNPMSTEPAAISSDGSATSPKIWRIGTLVYTTSSLIVLFSWLLWGDFAYQLRDRALSQRTGAAGYRSHADLQLFE